MSFPLAEELAGDRGGPAVVEPGLPDGPRGPRMVQAWFWLKRPVWFLDHCRRRYGDVFTMRMPFGTDLVHVADPELVKAVFGGDHEVLRAGEANGMFLEPLVGPHSVLVLDGPEHLRQRKLILPAFHGERMRGWADAIRDITRAQIARWPVGTPFALRPSMQSITLDVIIRVIFGVDGAARADDLRRRILVITRLGRSPLLLYATAERRLGPHAPWPRFLRARDELSAALVAEIRERRRAADLAQRRDVLSQLLLARDEAGAAMADDEVSDELITLLFAGHETTATALAWAFDLLLHHPAALRRLVAELEGGGSEYLEATIKETLRVRPVVALVDRHVREATRIGVHTIPAGTLLCPNVYLAQRREDLYPDPGAFRPERFVGQPPPSFGWFPFGGGLRRCIGASFATFEMQIVLPEVLRAVILEPASRRPARVRREAVTFVPHDGARCVLTARRHVDAPAAAGLGLPSKRLVSAFGDQRSSPAWKPSGHAAVHLATATIREMSAMPVKYLSQEWVEAYNATMAGDEAVRAALKGKSAVLQMVISGAPQGEVRYWLRIADGSATAGLGDNPDADVTISQSYETSAQVNQGELDGQKAFMQGKVKIAGKMLKMMQLRGPLEKVQTALTAIDTEY